MIMNGNKPGSIINCPPWNNHKIKYQEKFGFNDYECEGGVGGGLPSME